MSRSTDLFKYMQEVKLIFHLPTSPPNSELIPRLKYPTAQPTGSSRTPGGE